MKKLMIKFCCLALISYSLYSFEMPEAHSDCQPQTHYVSLEDAVSQFKKINASSTPVLKPTWIPFNATTERYFIVGCGTSLKMEYESNRDKLRFHIYPELNILDSINKHVFLLRDGTKAEYMENDMYFAIRFNKEGRLYMILVDKMKKNSKEVAIKNLLKISDSLEVFKER
ncbi:hypothetical protein J2T13_004844 [Paenibacillus sp. DS2015]|uniref:hypothetical protein n=1 Tax=Paenibacillus sp. DS2015 TaxID=3373917 RepID=UPI003D1D8D2F